MWAARGCYLAGIAAASDAKILYAGNLLSITHTPAQAKGISFPAAHSPQIRSI